MRGPLVHVAFRGGRRELFQNPRGLEIREGDYVHVEAERGADLGRVIVAEGPDLRRRRNQPVRALLRVATPQEVARLGVIAQEDREAHEICRSRAERFQLQMKVIDAETQYDSNRVTFYFTADRRVDFRELVRDLARIFRTRIELRQVGARDAARRCDGIGPCGRQLCCTSFLREFDPVTLKMAKQQNLALNPSKISGSCGRLMCCLTYEVRAYQEAVREAPEVGSRWELEGQLCTVVRQDIGNHRLLLRDAEGHLRYSDLETFRAEAVPQETAGDSTESETEAVESTALQRGKSPQPPPAPSDESAG
ncbi:MAG: stage 0 sporulation protein [Candidatus Eisenbacteria bacterium]|nr:stage 0 sporulation protein [Candidatus Eisenbacteria bacterium]